MISEIIFRSFCDELEKISAKTIPVKGAKGRRNSDQLARVRPEPKEPVGLIAKPKLPRPARRS